MDSIESRTQKLETGKQPLDWILHKTSWKLESFSVIFKNAKPIEETKNKNETHPNMARDFCRVAFLRKLMAIVCLSAPSLTDVAQHLASQCLSLYL